MRFAQYAFATLAVGAALTTTSPVATAETPETPQQGQVIVFEHEFVPLKVFDDPKGCVALPVATHHVYNWTTAPITIYVDPFCMTPMEPFARLKPGYGTHVTTVGAFRA